MTPDDIMHLAWVSDPQLSPDGTQVAYVVTRVDEAANTYRSRVWRMPVDASTRPVPVSAGTQRDGSPRWAPDGSAIAYVSTKRGDDGITSALCLMAADGPGEPAALAEYEETIASPVWSPDGDRLAFCARVRGPHYDQKEVGRRPPRRIDRPMYRLNGEGVIIDRPTHIMVVPADGSAAPLDLTPGPREFSEPSWFPDGTRLAATCSDAASKPIGTTVHVLDATAAGPTRRVTHPDGTAGIPSVSPDGHHIAVVGYDDVSVYPTNDHVGIVGTEAADARPDWLSTSFDRTWGAFPHLAPPQWHDNSLWASVQDRGRISLYRVGLDSSVEPVLTGNRTITGWASGGRVTAFTAESTDRPAELYVLCDGAEVRLTHVTDSFVSQARPVTPERFVARSGDVEVDVWVHLPPDLDPDARHPALLNVHGGPFTQYGEYFYDEAQHQARAGFVVITSNPRGGSGREDTWGRAIMGPKHHHPGSGWGSVDADDLMAVVDAALERYPFIDPERLGVIGGSYGGYMTSWLIAHTDRFTAACSERAANNLLSLEQNADLAGLFHVWFGPSHRDDPEEYRRMSPLTYAADMTTPLLIIHSDDDLRCPVDQADQLFNALRDLGREPEYWLFPGETHELSRSGSPVHRVQRAEIILEFFTRHLMSPS